MSTSVTSDMQKSTCILLGLVTAVVASIVVLTVVFVVVKDEDEETLPPENSTYKDIFPEPFNATWISNQELLYPNAAGHLIIFNAYTGQKTEIFPLSPDMDGDEKFELSADRDYLKVHFKLNDKHHGKVVIITMKNKDTKDLIVNGETNFFLTVWSPVGNALAIVCGRNLFYQPSVDSEPVRITADDDNGAVYNGVPDWIYEEEVFNTNQAVWFSPDGTQLVFARFDDEMVEKVMLLSHKIGEQYPKSEEIRYPKPGTVNPNVTLHWVGLGNVTKVRTLIPPFEEPILASVSWPKNDTVVAVWQNRIQNKAFMIYYTITEDWYEANAILVIKQKSGWLDFFPRPFYSENGDSVAVILPFSGGNDTYPHIGLLSTAGVDDLTEGEFVVTKIVGWNWGLERIFFLANTPEDLGVQHLYDVAIYSKQTKCLSCEVKSKNKEEDCLYNEATFSTDASHYSLICGGPDVPDISIYSLTGKVIDWNENNQLKEKRTPKTKKMSFDIEDGFTADVLLRLPPDVKETARHMYPLLLIFAGGPDSAQVTEQYDLSWGSYLATAKGFVCAVIDGRGSTLKGDRVKYAIYEHIGSIEIDDQLNVMKQLLNQLCYVDPGKVAVLGMNLGSYATGMILAKDEKDIFKCGIAIAPVTDWVLHNSIYTERYMNLPQTNVEGYSSASLLSKKYPNKTVLLVHGTYDRKVHFLNSLVWSGVLQKSGALLTELFYFDEDHGLSGVRPELYRSIGEFLDGCFSENDH